MPTVDHTGRIVKRLAQLAACLDQAVQLTEEIIDDFATSLESTPNSLRASVAAEKHSDRFPIIDRTTFKVHWAGKTCHLGNTLPFKFLERLARRPNQLFPCNQLLDEVWQGCRSREAMRSVVKVLRQKLGQSGMQDLAESIDGTTTGHYGLMLNGRL